MCAVVSSHGVCVHAVVCDKTACCEKSGPFANTCTVDECAAAVISSCPPTPPTDKPTIPSPTKAPTTVLEGNCFVTANDCPSGQECVPLREASYDALLDWNPRGNCKPISYTCSMWQVSRMIVSSGSMPFFDVSLFVFHHSQDVCAGKWICGPSIEYLKFNALPQPVRAFVAFTSSFGY
jgi:hypothetical protein